MRIVSWLLPWLGVLIMSTSIALATEQALFWSIDTTRTSGSTMLTTAADSNSVLTGSHSNTEASSGHCPGPLTGSSGDIAYDRVK
jgi:hypothetical protein